MGGFLMELNMHWSDCAVHNAPAYEPGPCDCGWANARNVCWRSAYHLFCIRVSALQMSLEARIRIACLYRGKTANRVAHLICSIPGPGKHSRPDDPLYPPRRYVVQLHDYGRDRKS